ISFQNYSRDAFDSKNGAGFAGPDVSSAGNSKGEGSNNYPLSLLVAPSDELAILLRYDRARYSREDAERWIGCYQRLLPSLPQSANLRVGELERLAQGEPERAERQAVLAMGVAPESLAPDTVPQRFAYWAETAADSIALVWDDQQWSYAALHDRAE